MTDAYLPAYLEEVSRFLADTTIAQIKPSALLRGREILADCISVIAAGMQVPEMRSFCKRLLRGSASGASCVIGTGSKARAMDAGLLMGTAGTWLELDEGNLFSGGHPAIQIVPAAVAVAQDIGSSGCELLRAVTLGYEVSSRIARASSIRLPIHPHGTYGVIGSAVAVGLLRGLNQTQLRELLNVSAGMAMAASRNTLLEGATVRNIFTGHSALMGQIAVTLVESGFTGERDAVKSTYGTVLSDTFDPRKVTEDLGEDWLIEKNYFKLHCTGRYVHSAIDALEDAMANAGIRYINSEDIERIDISAYKMAAMLSGTNITTSFGARFSIPFAIASIIYHGRSGLKTFDDQAVANLHVQSLTQRVSVIEDPIFTEAYPKFQRVDLRILMKDGSVLTGRCEVTKGEASKPHTARDLEGKFLELGTPIWGEAQTVSLFSRLMAIESISNIRDITFGSSI